jgi:DNA processing protein
MSQSDYERTRDRLIAWSLLPFVTPPRIRILLKSCDPVSGVCKASSSRLATLLGLPLEQVRTLCDPLALPAIRREVERLRESVVTLADTDYPARLREIPDPPPALFFAGRRELLGRDAIAVVGSRRASPYGLNAAATIAREISSRGIAVVSGCALGIDTAAHHAALEAGQTIGVLGTGIDIAYPRSNRKLFERIAREGLLVTEFPHGTPPRAANFPVRNRVIAGMAAGVVVVEAGVRSGSLITARLAAEGGREVFAVPGSIFGGGSIGPHRLIQSGAKLLHDVGDVFDELPLIAVTPPSAEESSAPDEAKLFSFEEPAGIDELSVRSGLPAGKLAQLLLELELDGWIRAVPGTRYIRTR